MNKFILVAMNRENHTQEELRENATAAAAYAPAAYAAAAAAADAAAYAEKWVDKYFERTGEDKQTYINEIERINNMKQSKPVFTQSMADNGELPVVGMECMILNTNCSRPKYIKGLIKYVGDLMIYAYVENGERCDNVKTLRFKPIDTRTNKEKAIDEMYNEMNRRFDLPKSDSEYMCSDDTQVGVEFLVAYLGDYKWVGE